MKNEKKIILGGVIIILLLSTLTVAEYYFMSEPISSLKNTKNILEENIQDKLYELQNINSQKSSLSSQIKQIENKIKSANNELNLLHSGERYDLHDPTYSEIVSFIRTDKTNNKQYDEDSFNCAHYAQEVNNNAENVGIRCGYVVVNLSVEAHALVVFNTTDKGLIYYEPQSDEKVNLEIGKNYWADCVVVTGAYYYERDSSWDIEDFTIYW